MSTTNGAALHSSPPGEAADQYVLYIMEEAGFICPTMPHDERRGIETSLRPVGQGRRLVVCSEQ